MAVLSSMITTSPLATGTPFTATCMSAPADWARRITLCRFICRHSRTEIVAVPSQTSTSQLTSPRGVSWALLNNEFDEEDIGYLQFLTDRLGGTFCNRLLQFFFAFGRDERRGKLQGEQFENRR